MGVFMDVFTASASVCIYVCVCSFVRCACCPLHHTFLYCMCVPILLLAHVCGCMDVFTCLHVCMCVLVYLCELLIACLYYVMYDCVQVHVTNMQEAVKVVI